MNEKIQTLCELALLEYKSYHRTEEKHRETGNPFLADLLRSDEYTLSTWKLVLATMLDIAQCRIKFAYNHDMNRYEVNCNGECIYWESGRR